MRRTFKHAQFMAFDVYLHKVDRGNALNFAVGIHGCERDLLYARCPVPIFKWALRFVRIHIDWRSSYCVAKAKMLYGYPWIRMIGLGNSFVVLQHWLEWKYFRSGKRKRSIRGKMISWKTNQRKNAIFAILNLRGCKFTDEYFLKFSRGTWKNDIFSGQSNKGSCNCKLCKSKWPEI